MPLIHLIIITYRLNSVACNSLKRYRHFRKYYKTTLLFLNKVIRKNNVFLPGKLTPCMVLKGISRHFPLSMGMSHEQFKRLDK